MQFDSDNTFFLPHYVLNLSEYNKQSASEVEVQICLPDWLPNDYNKLIDDLSSQYISTF